MNQLGNSRSHRKALTSLIGSVREVLCSHKSRFYQPGKSTQNLDIIVSGLELWFWCLNVLESNVASK